MIRAALLSLILCVVPLSAQTHEFDLQPGAGWIDTNIDLTAGDTLHIAATGQLQYSNARQANGPAGLPRGFADLIRNLPVNSAGRGALVGRIGSIEAARPFLIGELMNSQAPVTGRLFLSINQMSLDQATALITSRLSAKQLRPHKPRRDRTSRFLHSLSRSSTPSHAASAIPMTLPATASISFSSVHKTAFSRHSKLPAGSQSTAPKKTPSFAASSPAYRRKPT